MNNYLRQTELLNFDHPSIKNLILQEGWRDLPDKEKILYTYNYVRDRILFGYNDDDAISASHILKDGYGQCNTKSILFMALLRSVHIPCRLHGFTIKKELQSGVITGIWFALTPDELVHSWVEILYNGKWINIEGFILDQAYVQSVQNKFSDCSGGFCGYGIATSNLKNPEIHWNGNDTYIQKNAIVADLGLYNDPDIFFKSHKQKINILVKFMYRNVIRRVLNRKVAKIRSGKIRPYKNYENRNSI